MWLIKDDPAPDAVLHYRSKMGVADVSDTLIGYYSVLRKTME